MRKNTHLLELLVQEPVFQNKGIGLIKIALDLYTILYTKRRDCNGLRIWKRLCFDRSIVPFVNHHRSLLPLLERNF